VDDEYTRNGSDSKCKRDNEEQTKDQFVFVFMFPSPSFLVWVDNLLGQITRRTLDEMTIDRFSLSLFLNISLFLYLSLSLTHTHISSQSFPQHFLSHVTISCLMWILHCHFKEMHNCTALLFLSQMT